MRRATAVQVIGTLLIVAGVGLWNIPAALVTAGILTITFGVAMEMGDARETR